MMFCVTSQVKLQRQSSPTTSISLLFTLNLILAVSLSSTRSTTTAFLLPVQTCTTTIVPRNQHGYYLPQPSFSASSCSPFSAPFAIRRSGSSSKRNSESNSNSGSENNAPNTDFAKAPTFDGKMVFPIRALTAGLTGHTVAAVYAIISKKYKRGSENDEWQHCEHIGYTRDLNADLQSHIEAYGARVANVRALSFAYPQRAAMMEVASRWKDQVINAGGNDEWMDVASDNDGDNDEVVKEEERRRQQMIDLMMENAAYEDDDDEFEYDDEGEFTIYPSSSSVAATEDVTEVEVGSTGNDQVISPFASNNEESDAEGTHSSTPAEKPIFSFETVDKILDEVRPYLITDGGNVSVQSVDMDTKNVYLVLEGACGSCPSSTITMQMGIERVLRENFDDLGDVIQVEDPLVEAANAQELTLEAVQAEVTRIEPAISAMGGVVEILNVDSIGLVELSFRGPNRVQHGLELAIRDVPFVKHVKFVN